MIPSVYGAPVDSFVSVVLELMRKCKHVWVFSPPVHVGFENRTAENFRWA